MTAPLPPDESLRLRALRSLGILDTAPEGAFDDLAALASEVCETPIALVSLVDAERQWFKARVGIDVEETPREHAFCAHALGSGELLIVEDALEDKRFADNPLVAGEPFIRFYAGAPLRMRDGCTLGTLCVIDAKPRALTERQKRALRVLATEVVARLELRRGAQELAESERRYRRLFEHSPQPMWVYDRETLSFLAVNDAAVARYGYSRAEFLAMTIADIRPPEDVPELRRNVNEVSEGIDLAGTWRHLRKDGSLMLVEITSHTLDFQGHPAEMVLAYDVTERERARRQLLESEARLERAQRIAHLGSWELDLLERRLHWSDEIYRIFGVDPKQFEASYEAFLAAVHPDDRERMEAAQARALGGEAKLEIEHRIVRPDGTVRWVKEYGELEHGTDGRARRLTGTVLDVTESKEAAEQIRSLGERLLNTLDSITDAFFTLDHEWRIAYFNTEAERVLQRKRDDVLGREIGEVFSSGSDSGFRENCLRAVREETVVSFEAWHANLNKWLGVRAYPSQEGLAIYIRDVTELRANREARQLSEERFRVLGNATSDAIWEWDLDTNAIWWNEGYGELFGYRDGESASSLESRLAKMHPEDRARVEESIHLALDCEGDDWHEEYRYQRRDGSYAHVADRGRVIRDEQGRARRMVGGMSDITQRKEAEQRLAEQAALLDQARDAILVKDLSGIIRYWNKGAERLYGWTTEEAVGRFAGELIFRDPSVFWKATEETISKGEWSGELEQRSRRGAAVVADGRWTLLRDSSGAPKSVFSINSDITDRKKLEAQFLRAQRMESIGTLAGGIAHDLNNLLAPIVMGVDLIREFAPGKEVLGVLDAIERSAVRGRDLVKQVLSFSRGVDGARVPVAVSGIAREVESIVSNTFPKNISFVSEVAEGLWPVLGDPTQLNQALLNLCVNARDAMPSGGRLRLTAHNVELDARSAVMHRGIGPGRHVVVEIADEGCGMTQEVMDRIFEPFYTTKEMGKGTGLGLSTTLGIVRSHGGALSVYSEVGKGSVFKVFLPAGEDEADLAEGKPDSGVSMPRGRGELILVVDDEVSILDMTRQTLEAFGYRVLVAEDGAQAVGTYALRRDEVELVLTDMMMPVMDGPALIKALQRIDPRLPVIAASGLNANGSVAKASNLGVQHFLDKPYSTARMLALVKKVLDARSG